MKISIQKTTEPGYLITMTLPDKCLYIELFNESDPEQEDAVLTVISNNTGIVTYGGGVADLSKQINEILNSKSTVDKTTH